MGNCVATSGHAAVKRRVETRDLRHLGIAALQRFDEFDFPRQVLRIIRRDAPKFGQQLRA